VTAAAGRALAAVPEECFRVEAERAWRYVERRQSADGGWSSYWWEGGHYPTLQAVALARALGDSAATVRAAEWALSEQLVGGAWGVRGGEPSAFATALALSVLLPAREHSEAARRGLLALAALQDDDGGWPAHASMRIPPPHVVEPDGYGSWRIDGLGTGVIVRDHHRLFTTATCVGALALAAASAP
jgi:squalene cyclase